MARYGEAEGASERALHKGMWKACCRVGCKAVGQYRSDRLSTLGGNRTEIEWDHEREAVHDTR